MSHNGVSSLNRIYRIVEKSFFYRIYENGSNIFSRNQKIKISNTTKARQVFSPSKSIFIRKILEKEQSSINYMSSSKCISFLDQLICKGKYYCRASLGKSYFYKQLQEGKEVIKVHPSAILAIIVLSAISTKWYVLKNSEWGLYTLAYLSFLVMIWFGGYFYFHSRT